MSTTQSNNSDSSSGSEQENVLWEPGDDDFLSSSSSIDLVSSFSSQNIPIESLSSRTSPSSFSSQTIPNSFSFENIPSSSSSQTIPMSLSSQNIPTLSFSQQPTSDLISPMTAMELSWQESEIVIPTSSSTPVPRGKGGRPSKRSKFHGNQYTVQRLTTSLDDTSLLNKSTNVITSKPKSKRFTYKLPRCGYTSKISPPYPQRKYKVEFKTNTDTKIMKSSTPTGMRLLDIGIFAEAMTKIRCPHCSSGYLSLFESEFLHGWQTEFYIKCSHCKQLFAEFPSSKPMDMPDRSKYVNVPLPKQGMNEVTMRSVLSVHCAGFSWRDIHKFATIFDMPPPIEHMPKKYLNKIEEIVNIASETSMQGAANELHLRVDSISSTIPNCINTTVSFDSSWKTRGFYSNVGFGSAISATTKKVLDYVLLNRNCEKCNRWSKHRQNEYPEEYQKWYDTHKPHCMKNFSGSSQSMEPEAAKIIWSRSTEKRKLCYTTFIGDGDSKSYTQVSQMNPYLLPIHKEECLAHVSKRLKKTLQLIKNNTANKSYIQCKLSEPKADYIASNYSTVILQQRGNSPAEIAKRLNIFLTHASGDHSTCPSDTWCLWKQSSSTAKTPPAKQTKYSANELAKVREVFETYATEEFCSHLTLGLTQNANESLHNVIWNFCPKAKYISPQSVRISTAIAVTIFNEGELSLYGFMRDLKLNPTSVSFMSVCKREKVKEQHRIYVKKANIHRRARRQKQAKLRSEQRLLRLEGGNSYKSNTFGAETFTKPSRLRRARGERRARITTSSRGTSNREKGVKRRFISSSESDESDESEPSLSDTGSSNTKQLSSNTDNESDTIPKICEICQLTNPPSQRHQAISLWSRVKWVKCSNCRKYFHQRCTELDKVAEFRTFICFKCTSYTH